MSNNLSILNKDQLQLLINTREGEVKLGENCQLIIPTADWQESLESSNATFVLLGIPEDIGVRANGGIGGAHTAWISALQAIVNIQSTSKLNGEELLILGAFDFSDWMEEAQQMNLPQLRELVTRIDEEVYPVIQCIIEAGKIPIVIGGGHNNSFPLLKAASLAFGEAVNCINLDAHSDYRVMEGRHSGNGFRYAKTANYLQQYALVGLHENYNSEEVMQELTQNEKIDFSTYEDIFLRNNLDFEQAVLQAINFTDSLPTGVELDLDCIQNVLSSASTPSGISALQARQYVYLTASKSNPAYLHLAEGATQLSNAKQDSSTGKLLAYLVSDFMKAYNT